MKDFLPWLYQRYIKPYLDEKVENNPYTMSISLMESDLLPEDRKVFEDTKEFCAVYGFLLGLHTGAGLEDAL